MKTELTRDERWEWLRKTTWGKGTIPWDRMAIPHHEWMDEVHLQEAVGLDLEVRKAEIVCVPRYQEDVTPETWKWVTSVINDRNERREEARRKDEDETVGIFYYHAHKYDEELKENIPTNIWVKLKHSAQKSCLSDVFIFQESGKDMDNGIMHKKGSEFIWDYGCMGKALKEGGLLSEEDYIEKMKEDLT